MSCFKILSWHKISGGTICSNMSHKITIISFYILRIFMTVFTISEYFIGHHFQAVSYILKRRGNSLEESACVGCSRSECEELRIPQIWGRGQECVEWVSCQEVTTDCHWDPLWFSPIILSEQSRQSAKIAECLCFSGLTVLSVLHYNSQSNVLTQINLDVKYLPGSIKGKIAGGNWIEIEDFNRKKYFRVSVKLNIRLSTHVSLTIVADKW